jgi:hypothetical protein
MKSSWDTELGPQRLCGLVRHFKTDPTETVALFWIREDTLLTS